MQFAGAVAPLATNRVAAKDRTFILVQRVSNRFDTIRMTEQTTWLDWSIKVKIAFRITR
jgi:hypothetical protein